MSSFEVDAVMMRPLVVPVESRVAVSNVWSEG